jgi:anhydro-N-acetylmuramic acid kinase
VTRAQGASETQPRSPARAGAASVFIGLMSGTSLDGISAVVARFVPGESGAVSYELLGFTVTEYSAAQRARLAAAIAGASPSEYCRLGFDLGEWFAEAAIRAIADAGIARSDITAVASHGQTLWHEPGHSTWQVGEAAVIAERTGLPVVSDFRVRDVAAGGHGAPLVPIADAMLFSGSEWRALQNIGGIANVTVVPPEGELRGIRAFDTGPGMMVIDALAQLLSDGKARMDENGMLSRGGTVQDDALRTLLADPYFRADPPKSTGRERFGAEYTGRFAQLCRDSAPEAGTADIIATAVELTARTIADAYDRFIPEPVTEVLVSGGGARHPLLYARLEALIAPRTLHSFDAMHCDPEAKEALAFALLGWLHVEGRGGNVPGATGARGTRVLGKWTPV